MPHRYDEQEADEELEEPEDFGESYSGDTVECPYCGEEVFHQAQRCPNCGTYITEEDSPRRKRPLWVIIGFILVVLTVLSWVLY